MRGRVRTAAALVAVATVLATVPAVGAAGAAGAPAPSAKACRAYDDYFQVTFAVALITQLGEAFSEVHRTGGTTTTTSAAETTTSTGNQADPEEIRNFILLVLSPKLAQSTAVLARTAPRSIRPIFAEQRDVYREGVELLRDVGLSEHELELIREADFGEESPDELAGDLDIDRADLEDAAAEFGRSADVLTASEASDAQAREFQRLGVDCGSLPDSTVDCEALVGADLRDRLLGAGATVENNGDTCTYTGAKTDNGDEPVLGVNVYRTAAAYDRLVEQNKAQDEIDDDNATIDGYTTFSSFKTCGRTLFSRADAATVVVALCPVDDAAVPDADLTDVRDAVVEELG